MSDRRRNLFILLLAVGLLAGSVVAILSRPTKLGLDLQGGVQLVYQGQPTPQQQVTPDAIQRATEIMRKRVDQIGVAEPELSTAGKDQIEVSLPAVKDPQRAIDIVGQIAQMNFYDFEANLLDSKCKTNPTQAANPGGGTGGQTPVIGLYQAVECAAKCGPKPDPRNTIKGPTYYAFDSKTKAQLPLANGVPSETRGELEASLRRAKKTGAKIVEVPVGVAVLRSEKRDAAGPKPDTWWVMLDRPYVNGNEIKDPKQDFDSRGGGSQPNVSMNFTSKGRKAFAKATKQIALRGSKTLLLPGQAPRDVAQHFAIRLDNDLISTPYIDFRENPDGIDPTTGAQISGSFTVQSAQDLANLLKAGALPIKLKLISRSQVSATLGKQALNQGLIAGLAGFGIVALFLLSFYRILGAIASFALVIYGFYFYALLKLIPVTLTLPGIAGLILTIGVVADANIVIFERVKEEIRGGRSIPAGIAVGYKKGFSTIVDANVVTILTAFILYMLAIGGVKAFAFTLGIGTLVSLFTAVFATQAILLSMRGSRLISHHWALGAGMKHKRWRIDFIGASRWFFSMSGVILLIGGLAIAGNGLNFGIDFEAGTKITASLSRAASVNDVREALTPLGQAHAKIQAVSDRQLGRHVVQLRTETLQPDKVNKVTDALRSKFGLERDADIQSVGATFGATVANTALIAIIASLAIISLYIAIRFQWKYAVPVLISLIHDILITAGIYSLVGREVTASTVAALLTILGYSLYDTIIVFDRVRENVPRMPTAAFSQIVNRSTSEVLTRSLATSFCTVLPVLALFFFGGETLKDFAFALIVGIASGTYSSVFIAAPVLTHWKEREPVYRSRDRRIKAELGHVPAFAVAIGGAPVDVAPKERKRPRGSLTAPQDPTQVSSTEFEEMVQDLGVQPDQPSGGRRARMERQSSQPTPQPPPPPQPTPPSTPAGPAGETSEPSLPGSPDEKEKKKKRKKKKHRHGRPR